MNIKALTSSTFVAVVVSFFEMGLIGFGSRQIVKKVCKRRNRGIMPIRKAEVSNNTEAFC